MSKLIIIEGPDECGKTTLATGLCRILDCTYVHCTASPNLFQGLEDYHNAMVEMVRRNRFINPNASFIFDRFWPSEVAYGLRLLRRESKYEWKEIENQLAEAGAIYIWCFSSKGWSRYQEGHTDPAHALTQVEYRQIYQNYNEIRGEMMKLRPDRHALYEIEQDGENLLQFAQKIETLCSTKASP